MGTYIALLNFGEMNLSVKNYDVAGAMLRECLDIVVEYNLIGSITWALEAVGGFLATTNSLLNAARVWGAAERRREKSSEPLPIQDREKLDGQISAARGALADDAAFDAAWQEGRTMTLEQAVALAQTGSAEKRASE